jgi:hypothetical protein
MKHADETSYPKIVSLTTAIIRPLEKKSLKATSPPPEKGTEYRINVTINK